LGCRELGGDEAERDVYIVGKTQDGHLAGLKTTVVETSYHVRLFDGGNAAHGWRMLRGSL
jgi:hypothetical protein